MLFVQMFDFAFGKTLFGFEIFHSFFEGVKGGGGEGRVKVSPSTALPLSKTLQ